MVRLTRQVKSWPAGKRATVLSDRGKVALLGSGEDWIEAPFDAFTVIHPREPVHS